ncbi:MAG: DNA-binding NtrC family response regulator [Verrucomicrobiales bacterium]|jgi:DNA-binding NtrC family response regulator
MLLRALLAVQSSELRKKLRTVLGEAEVHVSVVRENRNLWNRISAGSADLVLVNRVQLPDPALSSIQQLRLLPEQPEIIVFDDGIGPERRTELLAAGCGAVLDDEASNDVLADAIRSIVDRRIEWQMNRIGAERSSRDVRLSDFVSKSPTMQAFLDIANRVAPTESSILILGETGVGKELLANAIHNEGPRSDGPFVPVNCGALPETLLESELFGHEEGAFTGASRARRGFFEQAHGGTIFLDEIGEIPIHVQVKLLRVLQEYEIRRLGGESVTPVNVRVIAATNRDLEEKIRQGQFRQDLFYRLGVVTLRIPALRERREDIAGLVNEYVERFALRLNKGDLRVAPGVMDLLSRYEWPGNVRELANAVERAVLLSDGDELAVEEFPDSVSTSGGARLIAKHSREALTLPDDWREMDWAGLREAAVERLENLYFQQLLEQTRGRVGKTADLAGIQPRSLFTKMRKHGLSKEQFKSGPNRKSDSLEP